MRHRDIISEINRENDRRILWPLFTSLLLPLVVLGSILVVYAYGPEIDYWASRHPYLIVSILVPMCLFGLWRLFKSFVW